MAKHECETYDFPVKDGTFDKQFFKTYSGGRALQAVKDAIQEAKDKMERAGDAARPRNIPPGALHLLEARSVLRQIKRCSMTPQSSAEFDALQILRHPARPTQLPLHPLAQCV